MYELVVKSRFAAAHFLRDYDGPCAQMHGHTWLVEAVFRGSELDDKGMLVDFKILKNAVREVIDRLDHQNLNDLEQFQEGRRQNPTAENLARFIYCALIDNLSVVPQVSIVSVRVNESPEAGAVYYNCTKGVL